MSASGSSSGVKGADGRIKIYFLPNLFTAGNLICGFIALTKIVEAPDPTGYDLILNHARMDQETMADLLAHYIRLRDAA